MTELESNTEHLFSGRFDDFGLSENFLNGLKDLGYLKPTIVQNAVFTPVREGRDIVVQSRTGSGKTTAFCLPLLTRIKPEPVVQAIVLVPTRELARQVATEASRLGHHSQIKIAAIYGGASFNAQIAALNGGAQVVIGTPGRVRDLVDRKALKLQNVTFAVLDEADEMLSMGFWDDVTHILRQLPASRQTLLFSATMPDTIQIALPQIVKDPLHLNLSSDTATAKSIRHVIHVEDDTQPKARNLLQAIEFHHPTNSIVFCNTKEETEVIERYLRRFGFNARALNGDMPQNARERVMQEMRDGKLDLIVATDVAARGIDISGITHVFNVELPNDSEVYVHRTGRTGRIGKLGVAVNLIRAKDSMQIGTLKEKFGIEFEEVSLPPESDIFWMQAERLATMFIEAADTVEISQYRQVGESLLARPDLSEILAFLLRSHFSQAAAKPVISASPQSHHKEPRETREPKEPKPKPKPSTEGQKKIVPRSEAPRPVEKPEETLSEAPEALEALEEPVEDQPESSPEFTKLYITLGREDGFSELSELALYMAEITDLDFGFWTGMGMLRDSSSHIEVETEFAEKLITALNGRDRDMSRATGSNAANVKILCEIGKVIEIKPKRRPRFNNHSRRS